MIMKPSFLFIDTCYPDLLESFYKKNKDLIKKPYQVQKAALEGEFLGIAGFYSSNLIKLGCQAEEVIVNNEILQKQWAKEAKIKIKSKSPLNFHPVRHFPRLRKFLGKTPWLYYGIRDFISKRDWLSQILMAQIEKYQPDILYVLDIGFLSPSFLKRAKKYSKIVVGQVAAPLPPKNYLKQYDLIITSFPHYLKRFRKKGINSEYLKHAFEPKILEDIKQSEKKYQVSFIGGITPHHLNSTSLLEELGRKVNIDFWGYGREFLDKSSSIIAKHHGSVWGKKMYKILAQSKITINRHIDVAENYANNMRLYEATGMGAMLITDMKDNLGEIFEIGKEIETYSFAEELIEKIQYYSQHEKERERIARAGQERTIKDHNYQKRMRELLEIISKYI